MTVTVISPGVVRMLLPVYGGLPLPDSPVERRILRSQVDAKLKSNGEWGNWLNKASGFCESLEATIPAKLALAVILEGGTPKELIDGLRSEFAKVTAWLGEMVTEMQQLARTSDAEAAWQLRNHLPREAIRSDRRVVFQTLRPLLCLNRLSGAMNGGNISQSEFEKSLMAFLGITSGALEEVDVFEILIPQVMDRWKMVGAFLCSAQRTTMELQLQLEAFRDQIEPMQAALQPALPPLRADPLSPRARDILIALFESRAFDIDRLLATDVIAVKAFGPRSDSNGLKSVISDLRMRKLIETKRGAGGGCWLTDLGRGRAEKLKSIGSQLV